MCGSAVAAAADKVLGKAKRLAAHMLETAEADLEFAKDADGRGRFTVAGTDRSVAMEEIVRASFDPARLPEGMEPGLDDDVIFERDNVTYPKGCHIAEVEVEPERAEERRVGKECVS